LQRRRQRELLPPPAGLLLLLAAATAPGSCRAAQHPCEDEVSSACPDRPGAEVARCLKDESEHERPTVISSDCTDFIALNVACADALGTYCEEAFFSRDTVLCLTSWIDQESLSDKCKSVMKWAIPRKDEAEDGPTDELGMSEKDYEEKRAWQLKRKAERSAAVERMKESDGQKEKKRLEMEKLKKENPEEYKQRVAEEERQFKESQEQKKRDRMLQAALERKRREELGLGSEEEEEEKEAKKSRGRRKVKVHPTSWLEDNWLPLVLGLLFVTYIFFNVLNFAGKGKKDSKGQDEDNDKED